MKQFIFIVCISLSNMFIAQTLTQTFNEPKVGDVNKTVRIDTSAYTAGMSHTLTGAGVNWDFSLLKTASDNFFSSFLAPATVTTASSYPGTTVVQKDSANVTYIKSVTTPTTRTEVLGFSSAGITANFTNAAVAAVYPISFASTFSDNIGGSITFSTTNLSCSGRISYTADGTGTLTLGDGFVYNNVIRVKSVQTITASLFILPFGTLSRTTYEYYDSSEKFPVLSINYETLAVTGSPATTSGRVSGNSKSFTGISKNGPRETQFSIYPNPAKHEIRLKLAEQLQGEIEVKIYNTTGSKTLELRRDASELSAIDIGELSPGFYLVQLKHKQGSTTSKLLIE